MAEEKATQEEATPSEVDLGNYELIRSRLLGTAKELGERVDKLNDQRQETFGGMELEVIGNERVRTEFNCVPRDMVPIKGKLLFGYNVFMGLKSEISVKDIFSLHHFREAEEGWDLSSMGLDSIEGFLSDERFIRDFKELREYYKDSRLLQLRSNESRLLAVFQTGNTIDDVKVFRWQLDADGNPTYMDNRGERDHVFPPSHDFEWKETTADMQVRGQHPHINIEDEVFVETVGGDLTIKIEDNTSSGEGIYAEPVEDANQSLDDAPFFYVRVGSLFLLKVRPYREEVTRHFVYNARRKEVVRIDAIGQACVQLPEDHGIIFPGGYYLQTGDYKIFDDKIEGLVFKRALRSPNGEDVLYIFHNRVEGTYVLYPYNMVRKQVQTPLRSAGYSIFEDGRMLVFGRVGEEPTRVHPMQIWATPFVSAEVAEEAPKDGSLLGRIGNADLVRGISDCYTLQRLIEASEPSREIFEDVIRAIIRVTDSYYWLGEEELGSLSSVLEEMRVTAELIIDEFEKVQALRKTAAEALEKAQMKQRELTTGLSPERWDRVERFLEGMSGLRTQRGHLITLKEMRYIDVAAIEVMEQEAIEQFERVSAACIKFLLAGEAFAPLMGDLAKILEKIEAVDKATETKVLVEELDELSEGLNLLVEVVSGLEVDDTTQRTQILEQISEVFGQLNRVRAAVENKRKSLMTREGRAEFIAQFKLFGQSVGSALALCDTPERTDEQLSRLMVQLEELEGRFSEFDEFLADLATKREEVYEAFSTRKQSLLDERQRRVENIARAANRIIQGIERRARSFKTDDELNSYFAADPMVLKIRQLAEQLTELQDTVKADEILAKVKSSRQDALRGLRDRQDLFEGGDQLIKLGRHRFSVNTQPLELTMVPRDVDGEELMVLHLTGTNYYETLADEAFRETAPYWPQTVISESKTVYRGEYLAASILFAAEAREQGLSLPKLYELSREEGGLVAKVRSFAAERYEEGYERGIHDSDAALILTKLLAMRTSAGLLRFPARARAAAMVYWAYWQDTSAKSAFQRRAASLGRLRGAFEGSSKIAQFAEALGERVFEFWAQQGMQLSAEDGRLAGPYLFEELCQENQRFTLSGDAQKLQERLNAHLERSNTRRLFDEDMRALERDLVGRWELVEAWFEALVEHDEGASSLGSAVAEAVAAVVCDRKVDLRYSESLTSAEVKGLLGVHSRIVDGAMQLRLDEFTTRLSQFAAVHVPGYRRYRSLRVEVLKDAKESLRLAEFMPRVMSAFVRNKLINDVYLHLIGDNLAKQIGAAGAGKRTDLMGLLLLISPPGYGKTTLMEYVASRLGVVFMKVNGPSLGHGVVSLDPAEAPNATARQEVEKVNLAFEMGNNVMLYLDDIQHTNPEFLQKFISLCDATRRIEGVWKGRTRTYDFRGKKFCVVMAGNPYTESGEKFQIPDMLANRADTYNLGDILDGKDDVFALSYIENALTSNPVLAPLATRDYSDVYKLIKMAQGEEIASTELSHAYSGVELNEITTILQKLFVVQEVLLQVNMAYIQSASMDDEFRTEPRFQLQGSYRNMAKMAEKVVAAMNERELDALIRDHYIGEAQTLTTGAEHNLLKLGEIRGTLSAEASARWEQIKRDFKRVQTMGGSGDDPVARVTGTLGGLGQQLESISSSIGSAVERMQRDALTRAKSEHPLATSLSRIDQSLLELAKPRFDGLVEKLEPALKALAQSKDNGLAPVLQKLQLALLKLAAPRDQELAEALRELRQGLERVSQPQLAVEVPPPSGIEELLAQQVAIVERTLVPLVRTATKGLDDGRAIRKQLEDMLVYLRQLDERMRDDAWGAVEIDGGAYATQKMAAVAPKKKEG